MGPELLRADNEKVFAVIDRGRFLLMGVGLLLRNCHMIKAAIGDSKSGRMWKEIRGKRGE